MRRSQASHKFFPLRLRSLEEKEEDTTPVSRRLVMQADVVEGVRGRSHSYVG